MGSRALWHLVAQIANPVEVSVRGWWMNGPLCPGRINICQNVSTSHPPSAPTFHAFSLSTHTARADIMSTTPTFVLPPIEASYDCLVEGPSSFDSTYHFQTSPLEVWEPSTTSVDGGSTSLLSPSVTNLPLDPVPPFLSEFDLQCSDSYSGGTPFQLFDWLDPEKFVMEESRAWQMSGNHQSTPSMDYNATATITTNTQNLAFDFQDFVSDSQPFSWNVVAADPPLDMVSMQNATQMAEQMQAVGTPSDRWPTIPPPPQMSASGATRRKTTKAEVQPRKTRSGTKAPDNIRIPARAQRMPRPSRAQCWFGDCYRTYTTPRNRNRHMMSHFTPLFPCPQAGCPEVFDRRDQLLAHSDTTGHPQLEGESPEYPWIVDHKVLDQLRIPPVNEIPDKSSQFIWRAKRDPVFYCRHFHIPFFVADGQSV
ncbi:hypothetical protein A0H81_06896 [Grifola frondosa]|uniref:C2H2-type domain-containing protein n=1 Tax=Grifola frondosa TaxID=5627 RepID=A0A1C7M8E6_GRIFR|nr:hypothetical protein A0H81_06896 [Grifola frondosa]